MRSIGRKAHKGPTITARPLPVPTKSHYRHYRGEINIGKFSSLRKLMRAARRGKMPDERQAIIDIALQKAERRRDKYLNSHRRGMNALLGVLAQRA